MGSQTARAFPTEEIEIILESGLSARTPDDVRATLAEPLRVRALFDTSQRRFVDEPDLFSLTGGHDHARSCGHPAHQGGLARSKTSCVLRGLTALREQAGPSRRELARIIGVSQPRIAVIERSRNVTIEVLEPRQVCEVRVGQLGLAVGCRLLKYPHLACVHGRAAR